MSKKPSLTVVAWSAGAASLAGFVAAWVLAARNGDLSDITAEFGPDRFMIAYTAAGTILAARRRSNPAGWLLLGGRPGRSGCSSSGSQPCRCGCGTRPEGVRGEAGRAHGPVRYQGF